eukprot:TRINITY_DN7483_c0_g1_i1.p2 TRINITY_DN7483_c0_g1~~TRINITY_DN7483_c0_g1_i1.p2  ORF type:complete len:178 (-),score=38.10 TRINITY_DN7483_c0_g1_i1:79-552(-)
MARAGGHIFALLIALAAAAAMLFVMQQCFLAPASPGGLAPTAGQPRLGARQADGLVEPGAGDSVALESGMPLAGLDFAGFEGGVREVKVAMFNKKSGRRDRSEGHTNRKKFRTCSLLARAATVKGRKILKKRITRGKHRLAPGDYENPKMRRVKAIR